MPLRNFAMCLSLAGLTLCIASGALSLEAPHKDSAAVSEDEVSDAMERLEADSNLGGKRTTRTLAWKTEEQKKQEPPTKTPEWLKWIGEFFSWLSDTARIFVWLLLGLCAALLAARILRYVRGLDGRGVGSSAFSAPTHVRDLDIRPESLPSDIGESALELWERGDQRAALSLLYRGLLSRLAHKFAVPIRASSTEGECRMLSLQHLPASCHDYVSTLIRTWQSAVYGGIDPRAEVISHLCAQFRPTLDVTPAPSASRDPAQAIA